MQIKIKLADGATAPKRMTDGAAGYDLFAMNDETIRANETKIIKTGVYVELPDGWEMQIRPRSGLSVKFDVLQVLGTIDSDYRGEIGVIIKNVGSEPFTVSAQDRIAQAVFNRVELPQLVTVYELSNTKRGSGGFGSTGTQAQELERLVKEIVNNE
jgi:dUTP pyrophosphatase